MWKQWVNTILGILVILMPYAIQSWDIHKMVMAATGVIIAILAFWSASEHDRNIGNDTQSDTKNETF